VDPAPTSAPEPVEAVPRRWSAGPIGLVFALLFLAGAVGYFVGVRTTEPGLGAVDEGFLVDMSDHHDQAVLLAQLELANGCDPVALDFATEVIMQQRQELGQMAMLMAQHGVARPEFDLDRPAMEWMDMTSTLGTMPGWASEAEIEQLRASSCTEADLLFLRLMQAHHRGGVHMADQAATDADAPELRELAERMARFQTTEIAEYQQVIDRITAAQANGSAPS